MRVRKSAVSGKFYEAGFDKLNKQIEECFFSSLGPGDLPVKRKIKKVMGVVSPHAGYAYSGACMAWAYKEVAEAEMPNTFVILGVDHEGYGQEVSVILDDWETPIGIVKADKGFIREIIGKLDFIREENTPFVTEHSIEVQLPFLQYSCKDKLKELKIAPFLISRYNLEMCEKLGKVFARTDEKICVIASSDFTHYGLNYNYVPFVHNKKEGIYDIDRKAIELICELDTRGLFNYLEKTKATICGGGPIGVLIEIMKNLKVEKGRLLRYYTSGDIGGNYSNAVGYGALAFDK